MMDGSFGNDDLMTVESPRGVDFLIQIPYRTVSKMMKEKRMCKTYDFLNVWVVIWCESGSGAKTKSAYNTEINVCARSTPSPKYI